MKKTFFSLVRMGLGSAIEPLPDGVCWKDIEALANEQGLPAVVIDGIGCLPRDSRPQKKEIIQWIGQVVESEWRYRGQREAAAGMAALLHDNGIRTYVLKGEVVSECYPEPSHRLSVDMDCFLLPAEGGGDVWEKGNSLVEQAGYDVKRGFYKNSTFHVQGLVVENHRFMTPFRGSRNLERLEVLLQKMMAVDEGADRFEGTYLYRPPLMVSALFLVEHAYSHFLHEGLTWRHILDWQMFVRRHREDIDWKTFGAYVDDFGFRKFYDSYCRLGRLLLGEAAESDLTGADRMMLRDVWAPLDLHETLHGVKGKLALAGNTWRARWKYREFTDISWLKALWIQVKGFLFMRNPVLHETLMENALI